MFWNDKSNNLTKILWKPSLLIDHKPNQRKYFRCSNRNISFNYYSDNANINPHLKHYRNYYSDNANINPHLKFKKMPNIDNTTKKIKLENRLEKIECNRLDKEIKNPKSKLCYNELKEKHFNFMDKIDNKVNNLDGFVRSHRVQIFPNDQQKKIISQWFYDTTHVYNKMVSHFTQIYDHYYKIVLDMDIDDNDRSVELGKLLKSNKEFPLNFKKLRKDKIEEFAKDYYNTPYCIIADTIKEFVSNTKSTTTKLIKRQITEFQFKHRKINRICHSVTIESHYTTDKGFYPSVMGKILTSDDKNDFQWSNIQHDYKLIYDKYTKKYYVHIPKYVFKKEPMARKPIAIMDPGERTFQALYGLDHVIAIGENMRDVISKRLLKIDSLKSKLNEKGKWKYNKKLKKKTKKKKHKYKRAIHRHHAKLKHLQQELHQKTAIYLCENYDRIMVTDFSSKRVSSKKGNLDKMTKRVLGKLSHYQFRQCLQNKCQEYGCQYLEVSEAYTTITCSNCGNLHKTLGTAKIYECIICENIMDRDVNAAINIFIKNHELVLK